MMNAVSILYDDQNLQTFVFTDPDGVKWSCAKIITQCLGYKYGSDVIRKHVSQHNRKEIRDLFHNYRRYKLQQNTTFINECGDLELFELNRKNKKHGLKKIELEKLFGKDEDFNTDTELLPQQVHSGKRAKKIKTLSVALAEKQEQLELVQAELKESSKSHAAKDAELQQLKDELFRIKSKLLFVESTRDNDLLLARLKHQTELNKLKTSLAEERKRFAILKIQLEIGNNRDTFLQQERHFS